MKVVGLLVAVCAVTLPSCSGGQTAGAARGRDAVVTALAVPLDQLGATVRFDEHLYAAARGVTERPLSESLGIVDFKSGRAIAHQSGDTGSGPVNLEDFAMSPFLYNRTVGSTTWAKRLLHLGEFGDPIPDEPLIGRHHDSGQAVYADDLAVRRQIINAALTTVRFVGSERLHGVATSHDVIHLDGTKAIATLPKAVADELAAWDELAQSADLDVWIDASSRLRRTSIRILFGATFRDQVDWWDFGAAPPIPLPSDLGDPTAAGGPGVTSFDLTAPAGNDHVQGGLPGQSVTVIDTGLITINVDHRLMGDPGSHWTINLHLPSPPKPLPFALPFALNYAGAAPSFAFSGLPPCPTNTVRTGTLTVSELLLDAAGLNRLRVHATLVCSTSAKSTTSATFADLSYRALG